MCVYVCFSGSVSVKKIGLANNTFLVAAVIVSFVLAGSMGILVFGLLYYLVFRIIKERNEAEDFLIFFENGKADLSRHDPPNNQKPASCNFWFSHPHLFLMRSLCSTVALTHNQRKQRKRAAEEHKNSTVHVLPHPYRLSEVALTYVQAHARSSLFTYLESHKQDVFDSEAGNRVTLEKFTEG